MANAILNVGQTGGQVNISTATAPATPAAGVVTLYAGTDKALHALNSDGVDITIAAAGAASPITVQQTNSLVSTAVGATATAANAIVIGATACATTNSIVIGKCAKATQGPNTSQLGGIVIGNGACLFGSQTDQSIAIGQNACASGIDSGVGRNAVAIGPYAVANTTFGGIAVGPGVSVQDRGVAFGFVSCANGVSSVALGYGAQIGNGSDDSIAIGGFTALIDANVLCSTVIGAGTCMKSSISQAIGTRSCVSAGARCSHIFGACSTVFTGATGTMVLGNSSVGGTGACNSVVIGNSAQTTGADTVTIGDVACSTAACAISIGNASCTTQPRAISIGNSASACSDGTIAIGNQARVCQNPYEHGAIAIGSCAFSDGIFSTVIGFRACAFGGHDQVVIGRAACANDTSSAIGDSARATGCSAISIGYNTIASAGGSITIGGSSVASHTNAVALGAGIATERADTTHVNSLVAYGQAASKKHAIGSTGGTVTVDFNNSNVQTLSLTSSISTLTKSNPIDGAVYTFQITQAGSGSYTIAWGTDVKWPGGTPPTLSTAVGAVDYVSLVYTGTNYYGNANLNFS